jgi:hypothetical protein
VPAGNYGEALIEVADQLCAELAYTGSGEIPWAQSIFGEQGLMSGLLSPADESFVTELRMALAKVAEALGVRPDDPHIGLISAALDGAEMTVRGELVSGNEDRLPRLMPGFVFMVALPIVDQDRALELSQRTTDLIAKRA